MNDKPEIKVGDLVCKLGSDRTWKVLEMGATSIGRKSILITDTESGETMRVLAENYEPKS